MTSHSKQHVSRDQLKKYREVITMWLSGYDTCSIARHVDPPESLVAIWVANFRDLTHGVAA